ncbi:hypothetical protein HYC85_001455 [Camellia sinensis]|uniref:Uncharacterized protein n=1 Tax=Camellia sinensis TaxID=4442 RepID=A0A7J7I6X4_CAMSI|nr:hypothetical protein HYC85_001455 [Camellia sinensis]
MMNTVAPLQQIQTDDSRSPSTYLTVQPLYPLTSLSLTINSKLLFTKIKSTTSTRSESTKNRN